MGFSKRVETNLEFYTNTILYLLHNKNFFGSIFSNSSSTSPDFKNNDKFIALFKESTWN